MSLSFGTVLALKSVRTFSCDRRVGHLDGKLLPAQLLGVEAPPTELRAVAGRIVNRLPVWQAVREELEARADELEARAQRGAGVECRPNVSVLYSPWG